MLRPTDNQLNSAEAIVGTGRFNPRSINVLRRGVGQQDAHVGSCDAFGAFLHSLSDIH